MSKHMPKVPPASRSTKGPGGVAKTDVSAGSQTRPKEENIDQQGQTGNINVNTHNQGYQQDR